MAMIERYKLTYENHKSVPKELTQLVVADPAGRAWSFGWGLFRMFFQAFLAFSLYRAVVWLLYVVAFVDWSVRIEVQTFVGTLEGVFMLVILVCVIVVAWFLAFKAFWASVFVFFQVICIIRWVGRRFFVDDFLFEGIIALNACLLWSKTYLIRRILFFRYWLPRSYLLLTVFLAELAHWELFQSFFQLGDIQDIIFLYFSPPFFDFLLVLCIVALIKTFF